MDTQTVEITIGAETQTYPIHIGPHLLAQTGAWLADKGFSPRALVISDRNVAPRYGEAVLASLRDHGFEPTLQVVPAGERTKSLASARRLYQAALEAGLDRKSCVVALGGGVVGDLAGFVAATFLRGLALVQLPTTLLAQVDSSVGGKVAVNLPGGKNLVGAFHQPCLVVADVTTLATLPPREVRAGWAEVIKHGLILDAALFEALERHTAPPHPPSDTASLCLTSDRRLPWDVVTYLVQRSCELKGSIVEQDPRETKKGVRAILNYGHTLGHALEGLQGYRRLRHGEAVAIGMVVASRLSQALGYLTAEDVDRIERLVAWSGLPTAWPNVEFEAVLDYMRRDKKATAGRLTFVILERIGRATVTSDVPLELVREVVKQSEEKS